MATIKYNKDGTTYSCWVSTSRITTPSLCFKEGSTTKYVPLLAVSAGEEEQVGNYYFKVGSLCARHNGIVYRAAMSGKYASSVSGTISTTITHSGKTGTSTTTQTKTITKSDTTFISGYYNAGGGYIYKTIEVSYGVTFLSTPSISPGSGVNKVVWVGTSSCKIEVKAYVSPSGYGGGYAENVSARWGISATGQINTTVTTYPDETKSATASGDFNYGVTYPSAPSLTVNSGGVTATNNSGNASFKASKSLSGTVAYGKSATLSQAFKVSFTGAI